MKIHQKYLYKVQSFFVVFIPKVEFLTSNLVNCIIQAASIEIAGLKGNVSLDLLILNSNISSAFLWVCLISVSQFLVAESYKSSVSFLSLIIIKFLYLLNLTN